MRLAVTGGREYKNLDAVYAAFAALDPKPTLVISGGARGADSMCEFVASDFGIAVQVFKADWARLGRKAGVLRNQEMIDASPDLLLAFPGGVGTADMVRRAKKAGIPVIEVKE